MASISQNADKRGKRGSFLPPAWIVDEETSERLTPFLKHTQKRSPRQIRGNFLLRHISKTHTFDSSANDKFQIVDNQGATHSYRKRLLSFFEFPSVQARRTMPELDTPM